MFSRSPVPCSLPYLRILISFDKEVVPNAFWISAAPRGAEKAIRRAKIERLSRCPELTWALLGVLSGIIHLQEYFTHRGVGVVVNSLGGPWADFDKLFVKVLGNPSIDEKLVSSTHLQKSRKSCLRFPCMLFSLRCYLQVTDCLGKVSPQSCDCLKSLELQKPNRSNVQLIV